MAVLWQSMEGAADERWSSGPSPVQSNAMKEKNTFLEKHLRIMDPLPSEQKMKETVQEIHGDRNRGPNARVKSTRVHLAAATKKSAVYGGLRPGGNTTLFIGIAGFQEINAYIEKNITTSGNYNIPILGNGTVVTWTQDGGQLEIVKTGTMHLRIKVGAVTDMTWKGKTPGNGTMQSKVVCHMGGVTKG